MKLKILTPSAVFLDTEVQKVDFEALDGFFTLLPKHIDFVNALKPTILEYQENNQKHYVACQKGVIIKQGDEVLISTLLAVQNNDLNQLKKEIKNNFQQMEEERKETLVSLSRLEIGLTRGLMQLNQSGEFHG